MKSIFVTAHSYAVNAAKSRISRTKWNLKCSHSGICAYPSNSILPAIADAYRRSPSSLLGGVSSYSIFLTLVGIFSLLGCVFALANPLAPFRANYTIEWHGLNVGESTQTLDIDQNHYTFEICANSTIPFFKRDICEVSQGKIKNNYFQPMLYQTYNTGFKDRKEINLKFNYKNKEITRSPRKKQWKLIDQVQDRLSHQLLLRQDLIQKAKAPFAYKIADGHKIRDYIFKIEKEEKVKTPLGTFQAIKLSRRAKNRYTALWYAPSLDYLLIKLVHYKNNKIEATALLQSQS